MDSQSCMTPDCEGGKAYSRGLCKRCYEAAYHLIRGGETTWGELEGRGLCRPRAKRGPKPRAFRRAFLATGEGAS